MGELHLDSIIDRMKREFKVECNQGAPQVAYKEAIKEQLITEKFIKSNLVDVVNLLIYLLQLEPISEDC